MATSLPNSRLSPSTGPFSFFLRKEILLLIILVLATGSRLYRLGTYGIFGDEKQGIMVAVGQVNLGGGKEFMNPARTFTPADFWKEKTYEDLYKANVRGDTSGNAVVYLVAMHYFGTWFGHSDFSLRLASVIFSVLTVLVIYQTVAKHLKSPVIALLAAFLAAIEPFHVVYSHQARFYTACIFFGALASYYFLGIMNDSRPPRRFYVGYTLAIIGTFFSNYLAFTLLVPHALYWLLVSRSGQKLKPLLGCYAVLAVLAGLWMTIGPGKFAFQYIRDATAVYQTILQDPQKLALFRDFVQPATLPNLLKRATTIFSDGFLLTYNLTRWGTKAGVLGVLLFSPVSVYVVLKNASTSEKQFFSLVG